jgi:putative ABC transport system permease protein
MLRLAPLILRNLLRNRRRSLLTLASTAMSLGILALLFAIYQSFFHGDNTSPSSALRIACRHKVSLTQWLPASYEQKIKSIDGVEQISTWSWFGGLYKNDAKNFFGRFAVDADSVLNIYKDWKVPPEQAAAFKSMRSGCLVAAKIATKYGIKLGDKVVIVGDIYPVTLDLTCVAISDNPLNEDNLVFHREYLSELLKAAGSSGQDEVGMYMIRARSADEVPRISKAVDAMFEDSPYPTRTESEKEFGRSFLGMLGNVKMFLAAIVAAVTFTILLVSANTVAMAVRERTREMAILRTLGFNPDEILQLIVGEAVLISVIGGFIGLGIGYLLSQGIESAGGFGFQGMRWQAAAAVIGIAAALGLVASLLPAIITSRKNIVESLRYTG